MFIYESEAFQNAEMVSKFWLSTVHIGTFIMKTCINYGDFRGAKFESLHWLNKNNFCLEQELIPYEAIQVVVCTVLKIDLPVV